MRFDAHLLRAVGVQFADVHHPGGAPRPCPSPISWRGGHQFPDPRVLSVAIAPLHQVGAHFCLANLEQTKS